MHDVEFRTLVAAERADQLRRDARSVRAPARPAPSDDVELRLARVHDAPALEQLARLDGRPSPHGPMVVAVVEGRIVAALAVSGGTAICDPFAATAHLVRLLELRASQLRAPGRRRFLPRRVNLTRYVNLMRGSIHA